MQNEENMANLYFNTVTFYVGTAIERLITTIDTMARPAI